MKINTLLYILFASVLFFSCGKEKTASVLAPSIIEEEANINEDEDKAFEIVQQNFDSTQLGAYTILEYVLFTKTSTDSRKVYTLPDETSPMAFDLYQGDSIAVIASEGGWIKILDIPWNRMVERPALDYQVKVGYAKREQLGDINDLKLPFEDLLTISYWSGGDVQTRVLTESDTLQVEEISKEEFLKNKKTVKIPFEFNDTIMGGVSKQNGVLTICCRDKNIKLKDVSYEESFEGVAEYTYLGKWDALNLHGVHKSGYEHLESYLYDADTGKKVLTSTTFFVVSPDGKYIVDMWGNPYESGTEFALNKRDSSGKIGLVSSWFFSKWVPALSYHGSLDDYYFGGDGALYVRVISSGLAGTFMNENQGVWQYVRIRLNI